MWYRKAITYTADILNIIALGEHQFFSQSLDTRFYRFIYIVISLAAPNRIVYLLTAQHLAAPAGKVVKKVKFSPGKVQLFSLENHLPAGWVYY